MLRPRKLCSGGLPVQLNPSCTRSPYSNVNGPPGTSRRSARELEQPDPAGDDAGGGDALLAEGLAQKAGADDGGEDDAGLAQARDVGHGRGAHRPDDEAVGEERQEAAADGREQDAGQGGPEMALAQPE